MAGVGGGAPSSRSSDAIAGAAFATASAQAAPRRSSFEKATTSPSSATRWPSGCNTTAGSRRCCTRGFPKHELVVRNLGFSGDEITTRLRSKNFGTPDEWLSGTRRRLAATRTTGSTGANTKADVIFAFFGYNESYAGQDGLTAFQTGRSATGSRTRSSRNTTASPLPRLVLFSPIAHENLRNPDLPDGVENNQRLEALHAGDGGRGARRVA